MNLQALTAQAVRAVTPPVPGCQLLLSTGYTTGADFKQTPSYAAPVTVTADIQAVGGKDVRQLDALNVQGVQRVAYLQGNVEGIDRARGKGGDLLVVPGTSADAGTWLVVAVLETWGSGGWCKVALTLQTRPAA
jgi:hypothetical protein